MKLRATAAGLHHAQAARDEHHHHDGPVSTSDGRVIVSSLAIRRCPERNQRIIPKAFCATDKQPCGATAFDLSIQSAADAMHRASVPASSTGLDDARFPAWGGRLRGEESDQTRMASSFLAPYQGFHLNGLLKFTCDKTSQGDSS
nr:hypothetical protein [Zoogloeaceae bacterium]